jgi:DNA-binding PadR family transcriptional regulator
MEHAMRHHEFPEGHGMEHGMEHGFGRGWGREEFRGRGPRGGRRGRRPNVRAAVLALLVERPMHGYEMIQELEQRTGGVWRPSPGSVYPTLQLLEDEGLIVSEQAEGRKRFSLTDAGREEAGRAEGGAPWEQFGADEVSQARDFREASMGIMHALRQVGFAGTPEQRTRALDVLNETRRKLYAILAEEN